ncbi:MAG TPA: DUF4465 domain-containing protein [Prolixibacteraceae bacterium]|nr:DUF4465 domain-containing protein [Prolixibacteraceae bacterium]HPS12021.1 DUF4465 domain-containing protein [Prolixibacteraceae bacterium]
MMKFLKNSWLAIFAFAALTACNDDRVAPEITSFALSDTTIHVGSQLVLEAQIQSDRVFSYNWIVNNKTQSNDAVFVFTPETSGEYSLKLIVENKFGTDSAEATITVLPRLVTIDFENLTLGTNSYWNGSDGSGDFTSGIATFPNYYNQDYFSWEGFAYSNKNDTITKGYYNQYSVYDSKNNANKYAIFYPPFYGASNIQFGKNQQINVQSIKICNVTYPALSMKEGDDFARKFGGATGNMEDFLKLIIYGLDASGHVLDSVNFYLADYRSADNSKDYIVNHWTTVNLSKLGAVNQLGFKMESSDNSTWGMNTPSYFAIDDIVYYEPEN